MPYNNALVTVKPNNNNARLRSRIDLVKLSGHAYWQFAILFSLAAVLQAIGLNKFANANTLSSSSTTTGYSNKADNSRSIRSSFLPRITNLNTSQTATSRSMSLPPIDRNQMLLANSKSLIKSAPSVHQVKQGETITAIANEYQVSKDDLVRANQLQNSNIIFVNQRLTIPSRTKNINSSTLPIANLTSTKSQAPTNAAPPTQSKSLQPSIENPYIAQLRIEIEQQRAQYQQQVQELDANSANLISTAEAETDSSTVARNLNSSSDLQDSLALVLPPLDNSEEYLPSAFDGYIWPAQGVFTSGYGWRWGRMHRGIDIAAPIGTPIVAAAAGTVIGAGWHSGYGNMIKLEHFDGSVTYYAHNHKNLVTHGQKVKQGEQIAEMGSTGQSTGSHLHFEIHLSNKQVIDPLALLGSR